MQIIACGRFYQEVDKELANLKAEVKASCGKHVRRVDRFIQLALIGAHRCVEGQQLPKNTGLYLGSGDGPKANLNQSLENLYRHQQPLMPLNFINMVSNAATFYVAQTLAIESVSLFNSHQYFAFQQMLQLADVDLQADVTSLALVGSVDECCEPLAVQREVLGVAADNHIGEGSYWLLLANQSDDAIAYVDINEQYATLDDLQCEVKAESTFTHARIAFDAFISDQEQRSIMEGFAGSLWVGETSIAKHHSMAAAVVSQFVESVKSEGDALFYINKDKAGNYRLLVISR